MGKKQPEAQPEEKAQDAPQQRNARVVKDGIVKPEDIGPITDAFLRYEFPDQATQSAQSESMKKKVTGFRSQYVINALNEIIGPANWRVTGETETERPEGAKAYVTLYHGVLEIGNWQTYLKTDGTPGQFFEKLVRIEQTGWSRNMDKWESVKGAQTNFFKKAASYLSLGWQAYALAMDEDFNPYVEQPERPALPPATPRPEPAQSAPKQEAGKAVPAPATPEQIASIRKKFEELGYDQEGTEAKIAEMEKRYAKPIAEISSGQARDILKWMDEKIKSKTE